MNIKENKAAKKAQKERLQVIHEYMVFCNHCGSITIGETLWKNEGYCNECYNNFIKLIR